MCVVSMPISGLVIGRWMHQTVAWTYLFLRFLGWGIIANMIKGFEVERGGTWWIRYLYSLASYQSINKVPVTIDASPTKSSSAG